MDLSQARLVIFASEDGADGQAGWLPLRPEEVPEWIRGDMDVLGHMVAGDMVHDPEQDARWFRAQRTVDTEVAPAKDGQVLAVRSRVPMAPHKPLVLLPGGR